MVRLGSTPVLDFGTFSVKAGFAGDSHPVLVYTQENFYPRTWPIVRGTIEDWVTFEEVLEVIWKRLKVVPSEEEVLLIEHSGTTPEHRQRMEVLMFEKYKVKYLTFLISSQCVCQASGVTSGIVLDVGHGVTRISAVIDNKAVKEITVPQGGQDSTECLLHALESTYPDIDLSVYVREIKERYAFATLSPRKETVAKSAPPVLNRVYELPNKTRINVCHERALCVEPTFGTLKGSKHSLAKTIKQLLQDFPKFSDLLAQRIILCGGPTECSNFNYRLLSELYKCNAAKVVRVFCPPNRSYLSWVGASALYFDDDYVDVGMSINEYKEKFVGNEQ